MEPKETPTETKAPSTKREKQKPPEKPKLIVFDNKVMEHAVRGGFDSYWPNHEIPAGQPTMCWVGQKMQLEDIWYPLMAFFEVQLDKTGGESTARLFYNPDDPIEQQRWKVWVFPQEWSSSMTAKELAEHPQRKIQSEALGPSYICYGSIHHHCKMSAFQSGTDEDDEASQNGIHITVGHLGGDKYDLNMRCYVGRVKYKLEPEHYGTWFNLNPEWLTRVPERINYEWLRNIPQPMRALVASRLTMKVRSTIHGQLLTTPPPKNTEFPEVWMENLIKTETRFSNGGMGISYQSVALYQQTGDIKDIPFNTPVWNQKLARWEQKDWNAQTKDYVMVQCDAPTMGRGDIYHPRTPDANHLGFQGSKFPPGDKTEKNANIGSGVAPPRSSHVTTKDETDFVEEMAMMAWEHDLTYANIRALFERIGDSRSPKESTEAECNFIHEFIKVANARRVTMLHANWLVMNRLSQIDIDMWHQTGSVLLKENSAQTELPNGAPPHGEKYDAATNTWGYDHEMMD